MNEIEFLKIFSPKTLKLFVLKRVNVLIASHYPHLGQDSRNKGEAKKHSELRIFMRHVF